MRDSSKVLFFNQCLKISTAGIHPVIQLELKKIPGDRKMFVECCLATLKAVKGIRSLYNSFYALVDFHNCQIELLPNLNYYINHTLVELTQSVTLIAIVAHPHPSFGQFMKRKIATENNVEVFDTFLQARKAVGMMSGINLDKFVLDDHDDDTKL